MTPKSPIEKSPSLVRYRAGNLCHHVPEPLPDLVEHAVMMNRKLYTPDQSSQALFELFKFLASKAFSQADRSSTLHGDFVVLPEQIDTV